MGNQEEIVKFLEIYKLSKLKQEEIENLNRPIISKEIESVIKNLPRNAWVPQSVKHLPAAQVMIPESWDQVPHPAPCSVGSLLVFSLSNK